MVTTILSTLCALCTVFVTGPATVIDGDTIRVNTGITIRLKGVDAAERDQDATRQLINIIKNQPITCALTGEKTWRRSVGYCVTPNGVDIGQRMVETGYALACPRFDPRYLPFETLQPRPRARARYCEPR